MIKEFNTISTTSLNFINLLKTAYNKYIRPAIKLPKDKEKGISLELKKVDAKIFFRKVSTHLIKFDELEKYFQIIQSYFVNLTKVKISLEKAKKETKAKLNLIESKESKKEREIITLKRKLTTIDLLSALNLAIHTTLEKVFKDIKNLKEMEKKIEAIYPEILKEKTKELFEKREVVKPIEPILPTKPKTLEEQLEEAKKKLRKVKPLEEPIKPDTTYLEKMTNEELEKELDRLEGEKNQLTQESIKFALVGKPITSIENKLKVIETQIEFIETKLGKKVEERKLTEEELEEWK